MTVKSTPNSPPNSIASDGGDMRKTAHSQQWAQLLCALGAIAISAVGAGETEGEQKSPSIYHVVIESATAETPRSDTASIAALGDGRLMVVYHKYEHGKKAGHDHGTCRIWSKVSDDGGRSWQQPRMLVDVAEGDMNVQAPALLRLKSGQLHVHVRQAGMEQKADRFEGRADSEGVV